MSLGHDEGVSTGGEHEVGSQLSEVAIQFTGELKACGDTSCKNPGGMAVTADCSSNEHVQFAVCGLISLK